MPITPFLRHQAFEPDTIEAMSYAFQNACRALGLTDRGDPLNELVARHIIELAQRGVRTPTALYMLTLKEFKAHPQAEPHVTQYREPGEIASDLPKMQG